MSLGENLKYYRIKEKLTQMDLAEGICVHTYISKIENDKITPNTETMELLCERIGIVAADLKEKDYEEEKNLIKMLLNAISKREKDTAENLFDNIREAFSTITNPHILAQYKVVKLRFHLFMKDREQAYGALNELKDLHQYFLLKDDFIYNQSLGLYEYLFGNLTNARKHYLKAESIMDNLSIEDPEFYCQMAMTFSRNNSIAMSIQYTEKALNIFSKSMDFKRYADCNLILGINFNRIHEHDRAISYLEKVLKASEQFGNPEIIKSKAYHNLGIAFSGLNKPQKAIDNFTKSSQLKKNSPDKIITLYLLTREHISNGETGKAMGFLEEGTILAEMHQKHLYEIKFTILQHHLLGSTNTEEYRKYLLEVALPYSKEKTSSFYCQCLVLLGTFYKENFQYKDATHYYELAINYKR